VTLVTPLPVCPYVLLFCSAVSSVAWHSEFLMG
jgi:hypothetical protein